MIRNIGELDSQRALKYFADWTDRIAAGELPKAKPQRPQGCRAECGRDRVGLGYFQNVPTRRMGASTIPMLVGRAGDCGQQLGNRTPFHLEGGKGTLPKVVKFQLRPDPLAR
jgi:hypothetical protein